MTESTTDNPGDGALEVGSSVDDLFGDLETGGDSGDERRNETADGDRADDGTDGIEDRTAADIFDQLRVDAADEGGADDVLADESPYDIIASADEPDPEPETPVDDELLADDELTDLLLTGRTKDQEFLWIDPNASDDSRDDDETRDSAATDEVTDTDAETATGAAGWGTDDTDATASDTGTADGPSESESAIESESDAGVESDSAAVVDGDTENADATTDAGAAPETAPDSSTDAVADGGSDADEERVTGGERDDADASLETVSEAPTAEDAGIDGRNGDDAENDTETDSTRAEAEAAANADGDATAADGESSGPLGRLRSTLGGLF